MPINGWNAGDADNVVNTGAWADQSGFPYGFINGVGGANSYNFGPVINHYGTWGQLIYETQASLEVDNTLLNGLNGHMPANPAPDNSNWVQGHLVNSECGGYGDRPCYLTPISHNINTLEKGHEAIVQRLVNRGALAGSMIISFNPNAIANSYLIYRTQGRLPPAAGTPPGPVFPNVPNGIALSLGFIINGIMQTNAQVTNEFATGGTVGPRWFANRYYGNGDCSGDQAGILILIDGVDIVYP